jgi:hypothetical protein
MNRMKRILREQWREFLLPRSHADDRVAEKGTVVYGELFLSFELRDMTTGILQSHRRFLSFAR